MSLPVDNDQRVRALDPRCSVCVTAPAGSGKTELLSQRVLRLLAIVEQPEEILAITFTRKAAAEMHHRIIQALRDASRLDEPSQSHKLLSWKLARNVLERDRQSGWSLLENTGRLKIQTIDSLSARLTRQMPILSNFGAQPKISEYPQQCYRAAVHGFLDYLETDTIYADDLSNLLVHVDNNIGRLERLLITMLQRRDQWLLHIGLGADSGSARDKLESTLNRIIQDVLSSLQQSLQGYAPELLPLLDYAGCNLRWQHSESIASCLAGIVELPGKGSDSDNVTAWNAIAELLLTGKGEWRKSVNVKTGFPTETQDGDKTLAKQLKANFTTLLQDLRSNDEIREKLNELRNLPQATFDRSQWQLLESLTRILPALVAQLMTVFQQRGEVDFSQFSMAALDALGDGLNPTELALKLDHQLRHILVDEFQDTSSSQFRLLQSLLEGWQEANLTNPDNPRTVFIVGDGMQSIYGFREANVGLFLEARRLGVNGVTLVDCPLQTNFRSDPIIVEWINETFSYAFPQVENMSRGAVPHETAIAFNPVDHSSEVKLFGFTGDDAQLAEAEKTVELIRSAQARDPDGSIAILVRSRGHLKSIIPALSRAGLQWNATDIDPLLSYGTINDLLSLTKAMYNLADKVSWVALLRTPWIGLTNNDLFQLLAVDKEQSVWSAIGSDKILAGLSQHGRVRLGAVRSILQLAYGQRLRQTPRSWIEGIWQALGGAVTNTPNETQFVGDFLDLLERFHQGELLQSIVLFEQAVASLYASSLSADSNISLMTIHKSKGLEFDTVILPGLGRAPRSDDKSLLMWQEYLSDDGQESGLVIAPQAAAGSEEDSIYTYLRSEQAASSRLENTRLFYVAATRAVKRLYISVTSTMDEKSAKAKPPSKNSLLGSAWPVLEDTVEWADGAVGSVVAETQPAQFGLNFEHSSSGQTYERLSLAWRSPSWSFPNPLQTFYLNESFPVVGNDASALNIPDLYIDPLPRCVGVICHSIFEVLAKKGLAHWEQMNESKRTEWLDSLLRHHSLPPSLWSSGRKQIIGAVENTLSDDRGRWILCHDRQSSHTELQLMSVSANTVRNNILDRILTDDEGNIWIIDYKTSTPDDTEPREQFIEREEAIYKPQLTAYKSLLSAKLGGSQAIRVALYFTHYPYWHEILV
ncbi:MAG: UvrD-helicase domain-containing protein [Oceanicoccus sp.]